MVAQGDGEMGTPFEMANGERAGRHAKLLDHASTSFLRSIPSGAQRSLEDLQALTAAGQHAQRESTPTEQVSAAELTGRISTAAVHHAERESIPPKDTLQVASDAAMMTLPVEASRSIAQLQTPPSMEIEEAVQPRMPALMTAKHAHPEQYRIVAKDVPMMAFLKRKQGQGTLTEVQSKKLKQLLRAKDVTFDISGNVSVTDNGSQENHQAKSVARRPATPTLATGVVDTAREDFNFSDFERTSADVSDSSAPSLRSMSDSSDYEEQVINMKEKAKRSAVNARKLGSITCCKAEGRDCPKKVPMIDIRRPSIWSNPFFMKSESDRARVCAAFTAWQKRGTATVNGICKEFDTPRAAHWKGPEVAATADRIEGVKTLASVVKRGHRLALGCACPAGKQCHGWTWKAVINATAEEMAQQESNLRPSSPAEAPRVNEYLIIFAGSSKIKGRMAEQIKTRDPTAVITEYDIENDRVGQNVLDPHVQQRIIKGLYERRFKAVYVGTPCSSYSIVRGVQIRSKKYPRGLQAALKDWGAYLRKHNNLADFSAFVLEACMELDIPWLLENPACRRLKGPAHWEEFADWGTLWDQPRIKALIDAGCKLHLVPMCMLGLDYQKYVHILASPLCEQAAATAFDSLVCNHKSHKDRAVGKDERGNSKAASTATYPIGYNVLAARILVGDKPAVARNAGAVSKSPQVLGSTVGQLHVGSNRPHAVDGDAEQFQRADRWAAAGSLRCLEPELNEVLLNEALPRANQPRETEWEDPPPRPVTVPGPFTTKQLFPKGMVERVVRFVHQVGQCLDRAARGSEGWRAARALRPAPEIFTEEEALNPCGFGFAWRRVDPSSPLIDESVWEAVLPSSWPDDPPRPEAKRTINSAAFEQLAEACGFTDKQLRSWNLHGYPGVEMPNVAVLTPPHVGALKQAAAYEERNQRDVDAGFCSQCIPFPEIWPLITDPCNIVVQNGKPRLTIDKTMWISGRVEIPPYNAMIDLVQQSESAGRLTLVRVRDVARAAAILMSPLKMFRPLKPHPQVKLMEAKWDAEAFFRMHSKQRSHVRASGRIFRSGVNVDWCCNFGERDAPDHTTRESDGCILFCRTEMLRLDAEYPTKAPELQMWLDHRRKLRKGHATDEQILWDVLFWACCYVDDGHCQAFDDLLFRKDGSPLMIQHVSSSGVVTLVQQRRFDLYIEACVTLFEKVGHSCPLDKRDSGELLIYLGILVDLQVQRRILPRIKAIAYAELAKRCKAGRRTMPNGLAMTEFSVLNSLIHRLLHASDVIPLGRQHLFHLRQLLKQVREIKISHSRALPGVIISSLGDTELEWWIHQLDHAGDVGLPLASRYSFPGVSSESHLIRYSDASRELDQPIEKSGGGAWCVLRDVFYFHVVKWTKVELEQHSINVLEAHERDVAGRVFLRQARKLGLPITHTTAYIDNSAAEAIAESGRASTAVLNELNRRRLQYLLEQKVFETNERITSIDNDVADLLSRDKVKEALRFPQECGLECVQLMEEPSERKLPPLMSQDGQEQ